MIEFVVKFSDLST